jgi:hypothetical protein
MSTQHRKKHGAIVNTKAARAGMLALQRALRGRFVSSGGRPTDPAPTIRRLMTVRKQVWKELQRHAALLSRLGQHVSPGQLAAILLEKSVTELRSPAPTSSANLIPDDREDPC